ncbi:alpha/beta fold hydrolase [Sphingomonas immobilis]|jgi:flavin reductase (DIM6/NTAB) family NADH-FMN oxidoreductase RutF/pimeloyl-ACP methyl ester carboxylesterase|uniref:Alpha/beta fold hydrolase n=1 Tax=Sphingomonas immobilis TaxID=3063997 RepID=A0ABT8ZYD0_9SPHN|nr:alpha/beta fold hydrolase [Sphingomonas sp. CA1-15]MDO7842207.1 alpha/beta fold hydrolase [Sphingomonas sp. CA1-15]
MTRLQYSGFGGVGLAAEAYGSADDPIVLLLPGAGQTRAAWAAAAPALAATGRYVIALDLRGHGDSDRADDGRYDLDAYAGDLRAVLAELGSRPVIVAASLGGWIATAVLGEGGEHLATGLVLIDAPPHMASAGSEDMAQRLRRAADSGARDWDPRILDGFDTAAAAPRLTEAAARVAVPTLLVRGERSPLSSPEAVQELADRIRDVESVEIADAGHLVATDQADAFNAVLLDFLERRVPRVPPEFRAGSDPRTLRDALGCFATGVTVVTTLDPEGKPVGLTANSFTSVSLDPPLLLVCLANNAGSLPAFRAAPHFAVNVLHNGQQPVSGRFASRGEDRFAATDWETWDTGVPIVSSSLASFECAQEALYEAGDHVILVGRVSRVRFEPRRDPLLFFRGKYRRLHFS